ncbi:zinc ribbon domain-containing protein [Haloprofundus sp. MHR1]|uniref:zinc ribbon domain-containing protein n=1 Tax=Haloprofundus sp. MHR1 TaxID=2572921 RepID=UPI0010BE5A18|nr:zinc ribbon domain-containing protein [Haloprofundus sp. MHR1]QCJ48254.1 zinc ribbon domain-containing protein [Haloprofundus sp. MHR1]
MVSLRRLKPFIAGALGMFIAGLGHLYLRRWRRAIAWMALVILVGELFFSPETVAFLDSTVSQGPPFVADQAPSSPVVLEELLLVSFVIVASALDAVLVGLRTLRAEDAAAAGEGDDGPSDAEATWNCPNCGKAVEEEMEFCPWCAERVDSRTDADG